MTHRDRQIICGLFLSKFNQAGLAYLGFKSFVEAFNALGYGLQARPASIKNYRDELDPYFPNERRGWHKRPLREHCRQVLDVHRDARLDELGELVKGFLLPVAEAESPPEVRRVLRAHELGASSSFAKRLITGKAAEQYFVANCKNMPEFSDLNVTDTTGWGCGFDFKLVAPQSASFLAVEVKGMRTKSGEFQMTELEHDMADALSERYYLVLVRNFVEQPFHTVIRDPSHCGIKFTKLARKEVRFTWSANVGA